ncbi:metallophosphoesterase family protein [Plantactinospora soyae]|uniref:3',5'-cyclic AMP phosphodiesterase CpdA n=1 Tax=Plantactinospora soyae TaxID=1544732 RepID=A0A927M5X6_9ACTN|nr:metallophosphoesterase [Plantactinospora soyae]MBE1487361.1 3',5'-cyclic AMP phosphodiesterase CpdA [Plantactinospora soyae]
MATSRPVGELLAVSDLHVGYAANRELVEGFVPGSDEDWLLLAGDLGERVEDIYWVLRLLKERFHTVVWAPGNHELWTPRQDSVQLRGVARYELLVEVCRRLGVLTPEDPYPVFTGAGGPVTVVPLFLLYDYTFWPPGVHSKEAALARAHETGIVCTDEYLLHPDPYPSREAWCDARLTATEQRLAELAPGTRTVLVNHFPMVQEVTRILRHPEFAQWCGTVRTADWHLRYNAEAVVYGHLHIPRVNWFDGVRFEEVSLGYPREWQPRAAPPRGPRPILPSRAEPS